MPATYYPAVIDRSASGFGVSFPDFPGLVAAGETVHDAALNAEIGLSLHLKSMIEDKDAIPSPSDLDEIDPVEGAEDVARILVRAETPAKFSRVQVTLEDSLLAAIDAQAANRSGFLSQAAWAALRRKNAFEASCLSTDYDLLIKLVENTLRHKYAEPSSSILNRDGTIGWFSSPEASHESFFGCHYTSAAIAKVTEG